MEQFIVLLLPGTSEGDSATMFLHAGTEAKVGIYADTDIPLPTGEEFEVVDVTPGHPNHICRLSNQERSTTIRGPGTFQVLRPKLTHAFGVYVED